MLMSSSKYQVPLLEKHTPFYFEETIKGSRFIARIIFSPTVEDAKSFIKKLNIDEPDATHHCWAYIIGNPNSTTLLACSDDGEPSGTAGMPMLNVLKHSGVGDITAVVTRYYGGTKLGSGGLARAYGGSVKQAIDKLSIGEKILTTKIRLTTSYDTQSQIEYLLKEVNAEIFDTQFSGNICISANLPIDNIDTFLNSIKMYQNKTQLTVELDP